MASQSDAIQLVTCGVGPALAAVFSNPLEVVKVRMQMHMKREHYGIVATGRQIVRESGVNGLQAGLKMSMTRELLKCSVRIGLYNPILKRIHDPRHGRAPIWKSIVAGGTCGVLSSLWANPLDLMKTRRQNDPRYCTQRMLLQVKTDGILSLWAGVKVSMMRSLVATASSVPIKYQLQEAALDAGFNADSTPKLVLLSLICSFPAATTAVLCMQPFDVVRTRLYNARATPHSLQLGGSSTAYAAIAAAAEPNPIQIASRIAREEGIIAFWKGTSAHIMRFVPHTVLSFAFIDILQKTVDIVADAYRSHS